MGVSSVCAILQRYQVNTGWSDIMVLGVVITLILWLQSLRLCPFHNKSLIAYESFRMFVAMDW